MISLRIDFPRYTLVSKRFRPSQLCKQTVGRQKKDVSLEWEGREERGGGEGWRLY